MNNREHLAHFQHREEHTAFGELGVTVKTYMTSRERATQGENEQLAR